MAVERGELRSLMKLAVPDIPVPVSSSLHKVLPKLLSQNHGLQVKDRNQHLYGHMRQNGLFLSANIVMQSS